MTALFTVTFLNTNEIASWQISRVFETLRAARKWVKFLGTRNAISEVKIYRGGIGGEVVQ